MIVSSRVYGALLHPNLAPIHVKLFSQQHGKRREHTLPHFGLRDPEPYLPLRPDLYPSIEWRQTLRSGGLGEVVAKAEQHTGRGGEREELASARLPGLTAGGVAHDKRLCNEGPMTSIAECGGTFVGCAVIVLEEFYSLMRPVLSLDSK